AEDGIRDGHVTGVQTCALPISELTPAASLSRSSPIDEERVSEAAGVNSAGGSFGLSFGLAFAGAIMLASLSLLFTNEANSSDVRSEERRVGEEWRTRGSGEVEK